MKLTTGGVGEKNMQEIFISRHILGLKFNCTNLKKSVINQKCCLNFNKVVIKVAAEITHKMSAS